MAADNGSLTFWDYNTGTPFQNMEDIPQPGSLEAEAGVFCSTFDRTGTRLITGGADKTIKVWSMTVSLFQNCILILALSRRYTQSRRNDCLQARNLLLHVCLYPCLCIDFMYCRRIGSRCRKLCDFHTRSMKTMPRYLREVNNIYKILWRACGITTVNKNASFLRGLRSQTR